MAITILIYATFTGLCGIASSWWELAIFRFLTGIGIGGEWAAGAALIAESLPAKSRAPKPPASCKPQAASVSFSRRRFIYSSAPTVGAGYSLSASCRPSSPFTFVTRWKNRRVGPKPNRLAIRYPALSLPRCAATLLVGTGLAVVATFGYQGAVQWVPSWIAAMLHAQGTREVIPQVSLITTTLTTGGIIGCLCMPLIAERWGRKGALFIYFLGALLSVPTTFLFAKELNHAVLASPVMGFFAAGVTTALRNLLSRTVSDQDPRHGPRLLLQLRPLLLRRRPAARRRAHISPRLLRAGNRHHRVDIFRRLVHSISSPAKPKVKPLPD